MPPSNSPDTSVTSAAARANRRFWDADAGRYHLDHQAYLSSFYWCPEMLHEKDARLLGTPEELATSTVLELGCGSAPCTGWLQGRAAFATGCDISVGMLTRAAYGVPLAQADVAALPYRSGSFDTVFSAFGAIPFVPDLSEVFAEVARVLTDTGRFVYSVTHPMRWVFDDDPDSLEVTHSYFEDGYVESDASGSVSYAEYHHSFGDHVRALRESGFLLINVLEPTWPSNLKATWGQWSPMRGQLFPGTAIFVASAARER